MHAAQLCKDPAKPTDKELAAAHKDVRDEFLAALMLSGANRDHYGALRNKLANQFGFGNDLYPKTPDQCLTMMNRRMDSVPCQPRAPRPPQGEQPVKVDKEALVFAQGADKKPTGKPPKNNASSKSSLSPGSVPRGNKTPTIICKRLATNKVRCQLSALTRNLLNRFTPWPLSPTMPLPPVRKRAC